MTNISFEGVSHDHLLASLHGVALSTGSACTSASLEASYVLSAIGLAQALAFTSLRFSLGTQNTSEEVDFVVDRVRSAIADLRHNRLQA
jgi:cysteine desulfurase